jgi:hypothetical protein
MKDRSDKIARLVMMGLAYAATEALAMPGLPAWVTLLAKGATVVLAGASPSVVGIKRTQFVKSATQGGVDQAIDPQDPPRR